jgi:hypothetical protein
VSRDPSAKLWRLLDVASAHEPDRSEQRANVRELKSLSPRQLDGMELVVRGVALATLPIVLTGVREPLNSQGGRGSPGCVADGSGGAAAAGVVRCRRG